MTDGVPPGRGVSASAPSPADAGRYGPFRTRRSSADRVARSLQRPWSILDGETVGVRRSPARPPVEAGSVDERSRGVARPLRGRVHFPSQEESRNVAAPLAPD